MDPSLRDSKMVILPFVPWELQGRRDRAGLGTYLKE